MHQSVLFDFTPIPFTIDLTRNGNKWGFLGIRLLLALLLQHLQNQFRQRNAKCWQIPRRSHQSIRFWQHSIIVAVIRTSVSNNNQMARAHTDNITCVNLVWNCVKALQIHHALIVAVSFDVFSRRQCGEGIADDRQSSRRDCPSHALGDTWWNISELKSNEMEQYELWYTATQCRLCARKKWRDIDNVQLNTQWSIHYRFLYLRNTQPHTHTPTHRLNCVAAACGTDKKAIKHTHTHKTKCNAKMTNICVCMCIMLNF